MTKQMIAGLLLEARKAGYDRVADVTIHKLGTGIMAFLTPGEARAVAEALLELAEEVDPSK